MAGETRPLHPVSITGLQTGSVDIDRTAFRQVTVVYWSQSGPLDPGDTVNYSARIKLMAMVMALLLPTIWDVSWADVASAPQSEGTTATVHVDPLDKYRNAHTLTATELADLLSLVGFKGQSLETALKIVDRESRGNPLDHNYNPKTGDNSYGLFQINMYGYLEAPRLATYGLKSNDELYDPVTNAQIAYYMSDHGEDFSAWKVYK